MSEKCDRCGEIDEDRRTLWMACFYAMNELRVPFKNVAIRGVHQSKIGEEKSSILENISYPVFSDTPGAEERQHGFYTLRVCKKCRAEWMNAIEKWFTEIEKENATGTGVFCRKNGANVELTEEEIKEMWPQ